MPFLRGASRGRLRHAPEKRGEGGFILFIGFSLSRTHPERSRRMKWSETQAPAPRARASTSLSMSALGRAGVSPTSFDVYNLASTYGQVQARHSLLEVVLISHTDFVSTDTSLFSVHCRVRPSRLRNGKVNMARLFIEPDTKAYIVFPGLLRSMNSARIRCQAIKKTGLAVRSFQYGKHRIAIWVSISCLGSW